MSGDNQNSSYFIQKWLEDADVEYETNFPLPRSGYQVDYLLPSAKTAIIVVEWKKPISITVLNKAITCLSHPNINRIYIVCKAVSRYVAGVIEKSGLDINIIHPFGLTDLAIDIHLMGVEKPTIFISE